MNTVIICILPQIFKTAKELDLGCGAGGGKDSQDTFKVGITSMKRNIRKVEGVKLF